MKPVFLIATILAFSCARYPSPQPGRLDLAEHARLRDEIRELIRPHCGSCHTRGLSTAKPRALAIFDLTETDWPTRMNREQLEHSFTGRLGRSVPEERRASVVRLLGHYLARVPSQN